MEESIFSSDFANLAEQKKLVIDKIRDFVLGGKPYDGTPTLILFTLGEENIDEINDPVFVNIAITSNIDNTYPEKVTHVLTSIMVDNKGIMLDFVRFYNDSCQNPFGDESVIFVTDNRDGMFKNSVYDLSMDELLQVGQKVENYVNHYMLAE